MLSRTIFKIALPLLQNHDIVHTIIYYYKHLNDSICSSLRIRIKQFHFTIRLLYEMKTANIFQSAINSINVDNNLFVDCFVWELWECLCFPILVSLIKIDSSSFVFHFFSCPQKLDHRVGFPRYLKWKGQIIKNLLGKFIPPSVNFLIDNI